MRLCSFGSYEDPRHVRIVCVGEVVAVEQVHRCPQGRMPPGSRRHVDHLGQLAQHTTVTGKWEFRPDTPRSADFLDFLAPHGLRWTIGIAHAAPVRQ
jgi:hypothetical protein